ESQVVVQAIRLDLAPAIQDVREQIQRLPELDAPPRDRGHCPVRVQEKIAESIELEQSRGASRGKCLRTLPAERGAQADVLDRRAKQREVHRWFGLAEAVEVD